MKKLKSLHIRQNNLTMSTTPIYNKEVAINAMLYVINRVGRADLHKVFKILYFADQSHLLQYSSAER